MEQDIRAILEAQLAKIPGAAGRAPLRRPLDETDRLLTGWLGAMGGGTAAKKLPIFDCEDRIPLAMPLERALLHVAQAVGEQATLLPVPEEYPLPTLAMVMGSGFGNKNPCLLCLEFSPEGEDTAIDVIASAKEGLIKQKTSQKAIAALREQIGGM